MARQVPDKQILLQAVNWHVDLCATEKSASLLQQHQQWLQQDPRHLLAWEKVNRLQSMTGSALIPDAHEIIRDARLSRRNAIKYLSTILLVSGVVGTYRQSQQGGFDALLAQYKTDFGERRQIQLQDNTVVHLNTDTCLDVSFSEQNRILALHRGEILVETAEDPQHRPFVVTTSMGDVQALGTKFSVYSTSEFVRVAVIEDRVTVSSVLNHNAPILLHSGEQLQFADVLIENIQKSRGMPGAWVQNQLIVRNWSLAEFLTELRRYHMGYLVFSKEVADLRISGSFFLSDTQIILQGLTSTLPIKLQQLSRFWTKVVPA